MYFFVVVRGVFGISRTHSEALLKLVNEHQIHPPVAEVFEYEQAREAFEKSMQREVVGKIVIKI